MSIQVKTNRYEASHGRKPKGEGQWWFENVDASWTVVISGSYGAAKKDAVRAYKNQFNTSYGEIWVAP